MEEFDKNEPTELQEDRPPTGPIRWLVILTVLFAAIAILGIGYAFQQNTTMTKLASQNQSLRVSLDQMGNQMATLTAKLSQMTPPPPSEDTASAIGARRVRPAARRSSRARSSPEDRRVRQLQAQLSEQEKQLKQTQDDVNSAKSDFADRLGSTRDELNGSIARTHDELVALEKRGERSYYEFDLTKSKRFQREGPIDLSLRKADTKHQSYNVVLLVNDHQLTKKKVVLYEPIWLREADQPVQVVVNKIEKNLIHGYVSAPKYTESQLSSSTAQPVQDIGPEPAAPSSSDPTSTSSPTPTSTPATSSSTSRQ